MKTRPRWKQASHRTTAQLASLGLACCLLDSITSLAKPGATAPPFPETAPVLWQDSFDVGTFRSTDAELAIGSFQFRESFSGYALERFGSATPLIVPGLSAEGFTNVMCDGAGALRFWVRPSWSSAAAIDRGAGPGAYACLAGLYVVGLAEAVWSLQVVPDGSALSLVAQSEAGAVELLQAPIAWRSGVFHLVVLNFGPQATRLYIDGRLAAQGAGTLPVPPAVARLVLGSTAAGTSAFAGDFDEVYSLGRQLGEDEVAFYYSAYRGLVVSWLGGASGRQSASGAAGASSTLLLETLEDDLPPLPCDPGSGTDPGPPILPPPFALSGLGLLQPVFTGPDTLVLTLTNVFGFTNDLYYTTNLALLAWPALCRTNWALLSRGTGGQTVFTVTSLPRPEGYFKLGNGTLDSDGDGLPDAYEYLVTHTDTNIANNFTSDGYTPDAWYLQYGLGPMAANQDADGDGLLNGQEYRYGTSPTNSEAFSIWVASPRGSLGIP